MAGHEEALLLGEGDGAVELGPAYVLDRLRKQQRGAALEQSIDLPQKVGLVADFMQHREGEGKIEGAVPARKPMESSADTCVSIRSANPASAARRQSTWSILGWTSTQTTLPPGPTISASGRLKKPIALPTSKTVMPGRT